MSENNSNSKGLPDRAAKHLANLLGVSIAGQVPDNMQIDIEKELFVGNNVTLASLVIVAGFLWGNSDVRDELVSEVNPLILREKSLEWYVYQSMLKAYAQSKSVEVDVIEEDLSDYGPQVWGEPTGEASWLRWRQIRSMKPSTEEILQAIHLRVKWATKKGIIE